MVMIGLLFFTIMLYGCGGGRNKIEEGQLVARINNYQLTTDDFKDEAALLKGNKSKDEILQEMITKKILLQEAQKLNLDKQKAFMKEIEKYWEQALLKFLIKSKSNEFSRTIIITKQEIQQRYLRMQTRYFAQIYEQPAAWWSAGDLPLSVENVLYSLEPGQISKTFQYGGKPIAIRVLKKEAVTLEPLEKMSKQISRDLLEAKKAQALEDWIEEIQSRATVKINQEVLNDLKLNRREYGQ